MKTFLEQIELLNKGIDWISWNKEMAVDPSEIKAWEAQAVQLHRQAIKLKSEVQDSLQAHSLAAAVERMLIELLDVPFDEVMGAGLNAEPS